jgi:hypothetical protein
MKFCKDCVHYVEPSGIYGPWCKGPHVPHSVVFGNRLMALPEARYSGGEGLDRSVAKCGELEANHFQEVERITFWQLVKLKMSFHQRTP